MELICTRTTCGFRANSRYFVENVKFTVGICPVDNGPIRIVRDRSDTTFPKRRLDTDPNSQTYRQVIGGDDVAAEGENTA